MKQFDTFILKVDLNKNIRKGMTGVILDVYPGNSIEAEFVKSDGTNVEFEGAVTFSVCCDYIELTGGN